MIRADFLAGANLENEDPTVLLQSISRFFKFLPGEQGKAFLREVAERLREASHPQKAASET
jgi:hypothetical protein